MKAARIIMAVGLLVAGNTNAATNAAGLIEINSADWGDTNSLMRIVELERHASTSKLRLTYRKMGGSVGSSMFIVRGFYEVAKARGAEYFVNLKEWDDPDGGRLFLAGFTNTKDADIRKEFGPEFAPTNEHGQARGYLSVSHYKPLFEQAAETNPKAKSARLARQEHIQRIQQGDLGAATNEAERFEALIYAVKTASGAGKPDETRKLAEELEHLAPKYRDSLWYGNAVQNFNHALGRIALAAGDAAEARKRLLASADSKGSPTMNSFGPNMAFAKELLGKGEKDTVLAYFDLCAKFWQFDKDPTHGGKLAKWRAQIEKGETPDFGANLVY